MNDARRAAWTYVVGVGALPTAATAQGTKEASAPSSSPGANVLEPPQTPIEWFVAGVAVGVLITVAWTKIRGGGGTRPSASPT